MFAIIMQHHNYQHKQHQHYEEKTRHQVGITRPKIRFFILFAPVIKKDNPNTTQNMLNVYFLYELGVCQLI